MSLHAPSDSQRAIIELPIDASAILVKAGPGSGKTRVLCDRIVHLVNNGVDPRQITAVTFTQLAAAELRKRIEQTAGVDVWTGTFHGYAYRILSEHGANWGFPRPIRVLDETGQRFALRNAYHRASGYRCDEYRAIEIAHLISYRKRKGLGIDDADYGEAMSEDDKEQLKLIDRAYHEWMRDEAVFDYDELIYQVNLNLRSDEIALEAVRADARWLLVDEFQDVSDDQYALISVVAPVGRDDRHLFAVGDERQSIYRFRGAASTKLFTRLKGEYRAQEKGLYQNFRSTEAIVAIANLVQPPDLQSPLEAVGTDDSRPIHVYEFSTPEDEAERVARIIQQRIEEGDPPESIAVLYSTHRRADAVEAALGRSKVRFYRHIRNSIHDRKQAEPLIALMRDVNVRIRQDEVLRTIGLKPAGLVDEIDWIRFDRARADGRNAVMTLGLDHRLLTLKDCIDGSRPPHTAHGVPAYGRKLLKAYAPLVDLIDESEWPKLLGNLEYVDRYVDEAAGALRAALDAKNTVVLLAGDSHDAYLAQVLLNEVLPEGDQQHGHFYFCLDCEVPEGFRGFRIDPIDDPTTVISLTLQAWRIAQVLLLREQFDGLSFVALDLETSGKYAERADIIEIGAARFDPETGEIIDRFSSLVQSNHLSGDIAQLTGITAKELHEAPIVHEVLQQFSEWLRPDDIFVGHNIEEFDLAILNRIAVKNGFSPFEQPMIDTLLLTKRLMPHVSSKLEDLMPELQLTPRRSHRALPDAETTGELFAHLVRERDRRMRVRALDGALPLVGASLLEYPDWRKGDGTLLADLAGRRARIGSARDFTKRASERLGHQWNPLLKTVSNQKSSVARTEEEWTEFRTVWTELIGRHHALMPQVSASELAASFALSASHTSGIVAGHVTLMTIHAAKGKEWQTVIMIGAEDDQFPSRKEPTLEEIQEGGRLFYVGVTRARSRLMITWAAERDSNLRRKSRHLEKIPRDDESIAIVRNYRRRVLA